MADWIDKVIVEDANELAKDIVNQNKINSLIPSRTNCEDCGDEISSQRQAQGGVEFCTECQEFHDKQIKRKQINLKC